MAGLHFDITGDNSNFIRKLHECENGVRNTSKQIEQSGLGIEDLFNRMTKAAAAFGAGFTAKELISNIAQVRGEFQQLEVAFKTMLGSEDKANTLMQQLVKTAATTPFDLQGVANGAKQLLAYGENVENVNDDLIRLGNIAAGLSQPLGDIVYLYGTTMTQGRLYTNDLNQFTGRGIPMIRELAKAFGVAENEVKGLVEAGKVGFPEVQKVIQNLTNEGGMFYNLMQEQSKTITGQISNIEDAIATMFNEIGKANEGIINDALSGVSYLVENYEKVGRILIEIVGTYGAYRTALMVTNALQALQASGITALTAKEAAHYGWLVLTKKAQDALNLSMLKNPYVLAAAAIAGLAYGIYKLATAESETEKAIRETNNALETQKSHYDDLKNKAGELSNILSNESKSIEERFIAYRQLQRLMPEVFQNMDWETAKRKTNAELIKLETDEMLRQQRIGLKTKVVMSQQKVQGLENSIIRTTNRGGYTGALKEDLAAAKKELEIYTKALEDFEKADEQAKKESEKPIIFNKKYWEGQKKEAEEALNSIASSQKKLLDAGKFEGIDASVIKSYKDNTKKLKEAEKELKVYDSSSKRESATNKQKKDQQKLAEELLSLRRQNQQAEIDLMKEGTEKELKQIDLDYQRKLDAIKKKEKELSESQGGKLTQEQSIEISALYTNAENEKDKAISDVTKEQLKAEQQALNDYLKEYGTFQQQKLAIAQEYAEKIKKAQEESGVNSAQVKLLEKQRDVAIQNKETEAIKANIDWATVFGEFGGMFNDMVKPALEEAKKYIQTDKFKNSDQASQKALIDAINQMEKSLGGAGGLNFKKLGQDIKTYQMAEQNRIIAIEYEKTAQDKLIKAQEDYEKALKNGTEEEKRAAKDALDIAQQNADTASANVRTQTDIANESQHNLTNTATNLRTNMNNVVEGLSKLASGGISSAYQGLLQAGSAMKGAIGEVTKNLKDVPIIGWIVAIIDVFKDGLSDVIGGLLDAVFNAVSGIIDDVLSGDLFVTIGESLVKGVSKIFDAITWGGFSSWTNSGESDPKLKEDIELLTTSNQDLKNAIDNLAKKMDDASVLDSTEIYNQQKANLEQQMYNTQEMMRRSAAAYSNGFIGIGGSHSSNKKINDAMSSSDWGRISKIVGTTVNSAGDFWNLTSEQMAMVSSEATDLYSKIKNAADDGYEDAAQYMDSYIGYYKELEELQNRYYEKLTSTSFDSIKDNFRSSLLEMKDNAEAFTEDFEEMMQNALLEIMMTDIYDKQLQQWYENFAKRVESGGELTTAEMDASKKEYMAIVDRAKAEWEKYQEMIGDTVSTSSQEASKKGFATASQDSIDELNGRFTALQISSEEIKNQMIAVVMGINSLTSISSVGNEILNNILTQHIITNSYLDDIAKYTKLLNDIKTDISVVRANTKGLSTR